MGYRAQVIKQHREYGSSIFSDFTQFETYLTELYSLYPEGGIYSEEGKDYYEIEKDVVKEEIKRLNNLGPAEEFAFQSIWSGEYKDTNGNIVEAWESALRESPEESGYVALEWY